MITRGLALSFMLAMVTVANGQAVVDLAAPASVNPFNPCGSYDPGEAFAVEVRLSQSAGSESWLLRHVQLNLDNSHSALLSGVTMPVTHTAAGVSFWNFATTQDCAADTANCGQGYYIDSSLTSGPAGIAIGYYFVSPTDLGPNPTAQIALPGDGSAIAVGTLQVSLPTTPGTYVLDVVNESADPAIRGSIGFGFGCDADAAYPCGSVNANQAVTIWRAGTASLTGGQKTFTVVDQALVASTPGDGGILPRAQKNIILLEFGSAASVPPAGAVMINKLSPGGVVDPVDLVGSFDFVVDGVDPNVLNVQDTGATLSDETWYRISYDGTIAWAGVTPFEVDHSVVFGDVNGTGQTDVTDVANVLANRGDSSPAARRFDVNGDGFVDVTDVAGTLANRGSTAPDKPDGHDCQP